MNGTLSDMEEKPSTNPHIDHTITSRITKIITTKITMPRMKSKIDKPVKTKENLSENTRVITKTKTMNTLRSKDSRRDNTKIDNLEISRAKNSTRTRAMITKIDKITTIKTIKIIRTIIITREEISTSRAREDSSSNNNKTPKSKTRTPTRRNQNRDRSLSNKRMNKKRSWKRKVLTLDSSRTSSTQEMLPLSSRDSDSLTQV